MVWDYKSMVTKSETIEFMSMYNIIIITLCLFFCVYTLSEPSIKILKCMSTGYTSNSNISINNTIKSASKFASKLQFKLIICHFRMFRFSLQIEVNCLIFMVHIS